MAETMDIIKESIQAEKEAQVQSVRSFVDGVEARVMKRVGEVQLQFGRMADSMVGPVIAEVKSYKQAKLDLLDPNFKVKDTEAKGAVAWNEKGGDNSIAMGHGAMDADIDEAYFGRVVDHEKVHQLDQAAEFNRSALEYPGGIIAVNPTLVEWHAITKANQPDSDLSPDYRQHKRDGDALVAYLGSSARLLHALKTGDMQSVQEMIDVKMEKALVGSPQ